MINTVIFDVDGTLLDTEHAVLSALQDTLVELKGEKPEFPELAFAMGLPGDATLRQLGVGDVDAGNVLWNKNILKHFHTISLFDGIEDVVKDLHARGYRLGIITSKDRREFQQDFVPFGLAGYFDTVICVDDAARPKPFSDPMLKYLERSGTKKEEAVYIGDTVNDMLCAADAKVKFGLAAWGCRSLEGIRADYYFDSPGDILHHLNPDQ